MKRFVTKINDSDGIVWQVWGYDGTRLTYRYAEFYGKNARAYAREHTKRLNVLPKEDQPK